MGNSRPWAQTFLLRSFFALVLAVVGGAFFCAPANAAVALTPSSAYVQVLSGGTAEQTFFLTRSDTSKTEQFTVYVDHPEYISFPQTLITLREGESTAAIHVQIDASESPPLGVYERIIYISPLGESGELLNTYLFGRLRFSILSSTSHSESSSGIHLRVEDVIFTKKGTNVDVSFNLYNSGFDTENAVSYILRVFDAHGKIVQETAPSEPHTFLAGQRFGYLEHLDFLIPGSYTYALYSLSPSGQENEIFRDTFTLATEFGSVMRQIIAIIGIVLVFSGLYVVAQARLSENPTL